eukprot:scaffold29149_cov65-Phaeocystis_antarctica.AAC.5
MLSRLSATTMRTPAGARLMSGAARRVQRGLNPASVDGVIAYRALASRSHASVGSRTCAHVCCSDDSFHPVPVRQDEDDRGPRVGERRWA